VHLLSDQVQEAAERGTQYSPGTVARRGDRYDCRQEAGRKIRKIRYREVSQEIEEGCTRRRIAGRRRPLHRDAFEDTMIITQR
jgi:hypothetical protein